MASKFGRTVGGNWTADATWSTTSGGAADTVAPTAADDVFLDANSGAITIDAAAVGRSLNCTGYTNVLTHNAFTLTLGDATAGASNIALKLVAGMTYTLANVATSAITFASTSATQQTIDFGGKTAGNITVNGSGSNYAFTTAITQTATCNFTSTAGSIHFDGASDNSGLYHYFGVFTSSSTTVRTLTFGLCTIELLGLLNTWVMATSSNVTVSASNLTIRMTASNPSAISTSCVWGGKTYGNLYMSGPGGVTIGNSTWTTVEIIGPYRNDLNIVIVGLVSGATQPARITGSIKVWGDDAAHPAFFFVNDNGSQGTLNITGATVDFRYVTFQDVHFITGGSSLDFSSMVGGSGDAGNNDTDGGALIFTSPTTQHWLGTTGGSTSDLSKWTSRIPLPQDTVIFDTIFSGSPTIAVNTFYSIDNADFSSGSNNVTLRCDLSVTNLGLPFKGRSGLTVSTNTACICWLNSRNSTGDTWNLNGGSWTASTTLALGGGGNMIVNASATLSSGAVTYRCGKLTINQGVTLSMSSIICAATLTSSVNKNTLIINGVLSLSGSSGTIFSITNAITTLDCSQGSGEIRITSTGSSSKTFAGKSGAYPTIRISGGGSGAIIFTGANTFQRIYTDGGGTKSITLPGSTTTTLQSITGLSNGTNLITFTASAGSATVSITGGNVNWDYVSLTNIVSTGGATFYAGPLTHSTDGGGNTGWIFQSAPIPSTRSRDVNDRLRAFFCAKTGLTHPGDAERAFWNNTALDFS